MNIIAESTMQNNLEPISENLMQFFAQAFPDTETSTITTLDELIELIFNKYGETALKNQLAITKSQLVLAKTEDKETFLKASLKLIIANKRASELLSK